MRTESSYPKNETWISGVIEKLARSPLMMTNFISNQTVFFYKAVMVVIVLFDKFINI